LFKENFITLILVAGGSGSRIGSLIPKQFLPLAGKPIALHSFDLFCEMEEIDEIVVVCAPEFRSLFSCKSKPLFFADPGRRRQDSIFSGFWKTSKQASIVCTHDAARPFIEKKAVLSLLEETLKTGAATLGSPVVCTIKECSPNRCVAKTLDRSKLWEIQTPQAIRREIFAKGISLVQDKNLEITDDTALAELLQAEVAVVPSSPRNFKITHPQDLLVAEAIACDIN
jgi:2-C-methyl-D-erythritol 4-phosphate cytidylyltransferase